MASRPRVVPSKDALHALRSIALSPNLAIASAIGSGCCLGALHYSQQRKIRCAERMLHTKRTIQKLSNGRGNTVINDMFRAAERGEDITLHNGRPMKDQKRCTHSAAFAVEETKERDESNLPCAPIGEYVPLNRRGKSTDQGAEADNDSHGQERGDSDGSWYSPGGSTLYHLSSRNLTEPIKRNSDLTWARQRNDANNYIEWQMRKGRDMLSGLDSWHKIKGAAIQMALEKNQNRDEELKLRHMVKNGDGELMDEPVRLQPLTDLNPIRPRTSASKPLASPDSSAEASMFFNFTYDTPPPAAKFRSTFFANTEPYFQETTDKSDHRDIVLPIVASPSMKAALDVGAIPSEDRSLLPSDDSDKLSVSTAHLGQPLVSTVLQLRHHNKIYALLQRAGGVEYYQLQFETISATAKSSGPGGAKAAVLDILGGEIAEFPDKQIAMTALLVRDLQGFVAKATVKHIIWTVVAQQLTKDLPHLKAVMLIYCKFGSFGKFSIPKSPKLLHYYMAMQYLEWCCRNHGDIKVLKTMAQNLLRGTVELGIEPTEQMIVPVVRHMVQHGETRQAERLVEFLENEFKVKASPYILLEIIRGYSQEGKWALVKRVIDKADSEDMTWKKPYGFSSLFGLVVEEYAKHFEMGRTWKFVQDLISTRNIHPTVEVSVPVLALCIENRRPDLVQLWMAMMQRDFPENNTGVKGTEFASRLATIWENSHASCEDVLLSVRALASYATTDPFSTNFRAAVSTAVSRDMKKRIDDLQGTIPHHLEDQPAVVNARELLFSVRKLLMGVFAQPISSKTRILAEDLVRQAKAVMYLDNLFSGRTFETTDWGDAYRAGQLSVKSETEKKVVRMPPGLKAHRLPDLDVITDILTNYFTVCRHKGLFDDHAALKHTVNRLIKFARDADALHLLDYFHGSEWFQFGKGHPFDVELFTRWLELAINLRSGRSYRRVLWAVVEAGPELQVSSQLVLLSRLGAPKVHYSRFKTARLEHVEECEYLRLRLRRRMWQQGGKGARIKFSVWDARS